MRHFADPTRCPDCGSDLPAGAGTCPSCHLDLSGALGQELFTTLVRADTLLTQMRHRSLAPAMATTRPSTAAQSTTQSTTPTASPSTVPAPGTGAPPAYRMPTTPAPTGTAPPARTGGASVPRILLGLGAVCVLVASLVFLAVTWSVMGVGGRTAILVALTMTAGALTAWVARRGLRGAVEALGLVTTGLVVLDLYGADNAGWLGDLSSAGMTTLVGAVLVAGGLAAVRALSRTEAGGFTCGELAAALGAVLVSVGLASQDWGATAARQLVALCLVLLLTAAVWSWVRAGSNVFRVVAWVLVPVVLLDWVALVLIGLDGIGWEPTIASAWGRLDVWPLLAAGAVALLVAVPGRLPTAVRVCAAALGVVPLGLAAVTPAADEPTTVGILAVVALSVALVALMWSAPSPWGASGLLAGVLCGLGLTIETLVLLGVALERYVDAASMAWAGETGGRLPAAVTPDGSQPWLLPLCVATLLALLWSAARLLEEGRAVRGQVVARIAGVALAVGLVLMMVLYPLPVWTVLVVLVAGSVAAGWPALRRDSVPSAALGGAGLLAAVVLSWYDEQLTAVTVAVALGLAAVVHLRSRREGVVAAAGGAVAVLLAGLVWTGGAVVDASGSWTGLVGLLALTALVLGGNLLGISLRTPSVAAVLEVAAAVAAVAVAAAALEATVEADRSTWLAVYLTVAGAAATVLSIVRRDRRAVAWLGGLLLAAATWVRLADLGVDEPEPYTLPSALALLVVGLLRLRRDRSAGTQETLGAGLALALVPSLLWVLAEPSGLRSVLLGLACLGLVVAGTQLRWAAPFAYGAVVGLVVVLVEAAPHVGAAVPRWGLIGTAGVLLIALGVSWEQRLREARSVASYVRGLR